jgi:hypothetical protein
MSHPTEMMDASEVAYSHAIALNQLAAQSPDCQDFIIIAISAFLFSLHYSLKELVTKQSIYGL